MGLSVVEIENSLTIEFIGETFHAILLDNQQSIFDFTVDPVTDVFTAVGHDFINGLPVTVSVTSGGALPSPLVEANTYYVRDVATDTFKLTATLGGAAIDTTTAGVGILSVFDIPLSVSTRTIAEMVRKEISDYVGLVNRPIITITSPLITTSTSVSFEEDVTVSNATGLTDLPLINAVCLVRGGSATPYTTTGDPAVYSNLESAILVLAGRTNTIRVPVTAPIAP